MTAIVTKAGAKVRDALLEGASKAYGSAMAPTRDRDGHEQLEMTVSRVVDLSASVRRLTFTSEDLRHFERVGADEYFGLLMPRRGVPLVMPDPERRDCRAAVADIDEDVRPDLRWYTIRAHRPELGEIDVDVVTHGDSGPGSTWVRRATVGDPAGLRSGGALYRGDDVAGPQLLVADETAIPAVLAILDDRAARGLTGELRIHVEVPDAETAVAMGVPEGAHVHARGDAAPGTVVLEAIRGEHARDTLDLDYAWLCGESGLVTCLRRHLVKELGAERRRVLFSGYWKLGAARP